MKLVAVRTAIFFSFSVLGAYGTTDILRLLRGSTVPVLSPDCFCPVCKNRIALYDQLPVVSYLICRGTCRHCKSHIPVSEFFLEAFLTAGLSVIAVLTGFRFAGFALCVIFSESVKGAFLARFGKREKDFLKNLALSCLSNLLLFGMVAVLFGLGSAAAQ